jgi:hypothetical protein
MAKKYDKIKNLRNKITTRRGYDKKIQQEEDKKKKLC